MFAGTGLQDWTSISAVSLLVHAVMVINIYFMYSDITLNGKNSLVKQSWDKVVSLSNHRANIGGVPDVNSTAVSIYVQ